MSSLVRAPEPDLALPSAALVVLVNFVPLLACISLVVGALLLPTPLDVVAGVGAALAFLAQPVNLWWRLLHHSKRLDAALHAWMAGDPAFVEAAGRAALGSVFRADLRTRALHLLGLAAELRGDFQRAAALFARAESALPAMASPMRKRQARATILAHQGLCLVAAGRAHEATVILTRANQEFAFSSTSGIIDVFTDDATWGLGAVSINEALTRLEGPRPTRAILSLAWALHAYATGASRELADLLHREGQVLGQGLLPRERGLADRLFAAAQTGQGQGALRSPGLDPAADPWVDAFVRGARGG